MGAPGAARRPTPPEALRQRLHGLGGGLPQRAQGRPEDHQADMKPLMGFALAPPALPPLHPLVGVRLQGDEDHGPSSLGRGPWTVRIGHLPPGGTRPSIEALCSYMRLERGFNRYTQLPTRLDREPAPVEPLGGAGLEVGKPSCSPGRGLLSAVAHNTTNRD